MEQPDSNDNLMPNYYLGREVAPEWYAGFVERISGALPDETTFVPEIGPGIRYISQSNTWVYCTHLGLRGDDLFNKLRDLSDDLATKVGPRTLQKKYTTTIHGFKYVDDIFGFKLIATVDDQLRKDKKWRIGEEIRAARIRFTKKVDVPDVAPESPRILTLGRVICRRGAIDYTYLRSHTDGKLLDPNDLRIVFKRFNPVDVFKAPPSS
ncbi:MAG: hypothetical protein H6799_01960 [Candidatus Nomurabacteria bacterium]|nr:MAG: hypothetical protein H6799_01960 [Candidatus Nomurabacteria bacterium]HRV75996.1 hypothetical protein [Candidatus Saccharimonadales bacterium]